MYEADNYWMGMGTVILDFLQPINNSLNLIMNPVENDIFFKILFNTEPTLLTSSFSIICTSSLKIFNGNSFIETCGKFLGIPCEIYGNFYPFSNLNVYLESFKLGSGNIQVYNITSPLKAALDVKPGYTSGKITATVEL